MRSRHPMHTADHQHKPLRPASARVALCRGRSRDLATTHTAGLGLAPSQWPLTVARNLPRQRTLGSIILVATSFATSSLSRCAYQNGDSGCRAALSTVVCVIVGSGGW